MTTKRIYRYYLGDFRMKITREMFKIAYDMGYAESQKAKSHIDDNPFDKNDERQQYMAWEDGFLDGQEQ